MAITIKEATPSVEDYIRFIASAGWDEQDPKRVKKALKKSLYSVCAFKGKELAGMARIVGDGHIYFYIQDVVVLPEYKGQGIGKLMMYHLDDYLKHHCPPNAFIGLMAAQGAESFYEQFGYKKRASGEGGMYKKA